MPRAAAVDCARSLCVRPVRGKTRASPLKNGFRMGSITDGVIETDQHLGKVSSRWGFSPRRGKRGRVREGAPPPEAPLSGASRAHPPGVVECIDFASTSRTRRFSRRSKSRASRRCALAFAPVCTRSFFLGRGEGNLPRFPLLTPIASDLGREAAIVGSGERARRCLVHERREPFARSRALGVARRRARRAYRGVNLRARALVQPRSGDLGNSTSSTRAI